MCRGKTEVGTVFRISQVYRRRSMLPSHLHDVVGSATSHRLVENMKLIKPSSFAMRSYNKVRGKSFVGGGGCIGHGKSTCSKVPHIVEPFLTLATVYEERGEMDGEGCSGDLMLSLN